MRTQRIIQHDENHFDIEDRFITEDGLIWAVTHCNEGVENMARTINGNLTGLAARLELHDQREAQEDARRKQKKESHEMYEKIMQYLTSEELADWHESTPDDNDGFHNACRLKLEELETAGIVEWLNVSPTNLPVAEVFMGKWPESVDPNIHEMAELEAEHRDYLDHKAQEREARNG
jgi:hypothetical protein